jgi:hypothetical protein
VRFKADENIPTRVIRLLREHRHDVATVAEEELVEHQTAASPRLPLLRSGRDHPRSRIRRRSPLSAGNSSRVVVVHARDLRPSVILMLVATFLAEHAFEDFVGCNVVIEPGALRTRRPHET